jgi:hypothetical protein
VTQKGPPTFALFPQKYHSVRLSRLEFMRQTGLVLWENQGCVHLVFANAHKTDKQGRNGFPFP